MNYTKHEINDTCNEIKRQWEYLLILKATFPAGLFDQLLKFDNNQKQFIETTSPPFYGQKGFNITLKIPIPLTDILKRSLSGVGHWLNQNFIIRLFGILDENNFITAGKNCNNPYTKIIALLRHQVGAHSSGSIKKANQETRQTTKLIKEFLDDKILPSHIVQFNLSIDSVLLPLTNECIKFIESQEGKEKPQKGHYSSE